MKFKFVLLLLACALLLDVSVAGAFTYSVVYRFCSKQKNSKCLDGTYPGGLIEANGTFYGSAGASGRYGRGTLYSLTPTGKLTVLHSFEGDPDDGGGPSAPIDVNGTLYGVTHDGGEKGEGIVYSFAADGAYRVVYSFNNVNKGLAPSSTLLHDKGKLYGTTFNGGMSCIGSLYRCGSVYSIKPGGKEKVVYSFCELVDCADGQLPQGSLIKVGNLLYGQTYGGPACPNDYDPGCGVIFSLDPNNGTEKVLYSFCQLPDCSDGYYPGNLYYADGTFYGGTAGIGTCGTVFSLTLGGDFKVLHAFGIGNDGDGCAPVDVIDLNGTLYGVTAFGGTGKCILGNTNVGCGTVFSISPSGTETVLYSFKGDDDGAGDGAWPDWGFINVHGTLYGTTVSGGLTKWAGTVFSIKP